MIKLEDLLKDYKDIKNPSLEKKEIIDVLSKKVGLNIKEDQILFRKNIVILKVSPVQKSFVYIRKDESLELIKTMVPHRFIKTIQF